MQMKKVIQTTHKINAPIDKIWANISKSSEVNTWLPVITSCSIECFGEGAKRTCKSEQGDLGETIVKIDHENKVCRQLDKSLRDFQPACT